MSHAGYDDGDNDGDSDDDDDDDGRERLLLLTTLWQKNIVLEPNMFPYDCPSGIEHYTLWATFEMNKSEIQEYVDRWLLVNMPQVSSIE